VAFRSFTSGKISRKNSEVLLRVAQALQVLRVLPEELFPTRHRNYSGVVYAAVMAPSTVNAVPFT
jgi:hypothetical protein